MHDFAESIRILWWISDHKIAREIQLVEHKEAIELQ